MTQSLFDEVFKSSPTPLRERIDTFNLSGFADTFDHPVLFRATGHATHYDRITEVGFYYEAYTILSYTACGVWISTEPDYMPAPAKRFVNLRAGKQWASATREEAMQQLLFRKRRHVQILSSQLASAEAVLEVLEMKRAEATK